MTKQETKKTLVFIQKLVNKRSPAIITPNTLLFEDGHLDSMNILDVVGYIEEKTQRKLTDEELVMKNFQSVSTIERTFFQT